MKIKLKSQKSKIKTEIKNNLSPSLQYSNPPLIQFLFCHFAVLLFVICCLLFVGSCRDRVVPPDNGNGVHVPKLKIEAEDVGVTDCFIRLKFLDTLDVSPKMFSLKRDGQTILSALCSSLDTLLLDEGLLPNSSHRYKAYRFINNTPIDSSSELLVPTLDTTSHEYFFQIDTLGDGNSSVLRDVFILNDTIAYAVGEIYKKDSTGQFETDAYNAAVWNGKEWVLKRIQFYTFCGPGSLTGPYPANAVFAFDDGEIWIASQSQIAKWKNGVQISITCLPVSVNKIWGSSKNNVYTAGPLGQIGFYNGVSWRRLESGTDVNLLDVWGSPDGSIVWACGWEDFKPTVLLRYQNGVCYKQYEDYEHRFQIRNDSLSGSLVSGIMSGKYGFYLLSDAGLYKALSTTTGLAKRIPFPITWSGFPWRLRGTGINNLIIVGEYFMLGHFNGSTFRHFYELQGYGRLTSVDQKNNFVFAVGYLFDPIHSKGIIIRGSR